MTIRHLTNEKKYGDENPSQNAWFTDIVIINLEQVTCCILESKTRCSLSRRLLVLQKRWITLSMSAPNCYLFEHQYAILQQIEGYELFQSDFGKFPLSIGLKKSKSLPKSPFGGPLIQNGNKSDLFQWLDQIISQVRSKTGQIEITLPISIYPTMEVDWMLEYGFKKKFSDTSHYVDLIGFSESQLHNMELRKLRSSSFDMELLQLSKVEMIHSFIAQCRQSQDLEINTSLESLIAQITAFPESYLFYVAKSKGQLAAVCIITLPVDNIAYYFLPATHPEFKSDSPMVSLMVYMYHHLKEKGIKYLDLGISSIEGAPQESLILFKEHMGGVRTNRHTLTIDL